MVGGAVSRHYKGRGTQMVAYSNVGRYRAHVCIFSLSECKFTKVEAHTQMVAFSNVGRYRAHVCIFSLLECKFTKVEAHRWWPSQM
jgi:hypothetical protein